MTETMIHYVLLKGPKREIFIALIGTFQQHRIVQNLIELYQCSA